MPLYWKRKGVSRNSLAMFGTEVRTVAGRKLVAWCHIVTLTRTRQKREGFRSNMQCHFAHSFASSHQCRPGRGMSCHMVGKGWMKSRGGVPSPLPCMETEKTQRRREHANASVPSVANREPPAVLELCSESCIIGSDPLLPS